MHFDKRLSVEIKLETLAKIRGYLFIPFSHRGAEKLEVRNFRRNTVGVCSKLALLLLELSPLTQEID